MKSSNGLTGAILLLFIMLWLPIGQHDFLIDHWMKIGTYAIPFLLIGLFIFNEEDGFNSLLKNDRFIGVLMLIAYILHQFEEHWIDLYGNYSAFYDYNNNFILSSLGAPDSQVKPLTRESIFIINTSLVWLVGLVGIRSSPRHPFPLICMASIIVMNGMVHILGAIASLKYNPGLLTSIVVFVPLYFWFIMYLAKRPAQYKKLIISGIVWAFLAHVVMVAGLLMANWYYLIPEIVYFITLVLWSLLPVCMFRSSIPQRT